MLKKMKMLQIRNLPDDLYQALLLRARRERRSLAQQAMIELDRMISLERPGKRQFVLAEIRDEVSQLGYRQLDPLPQSLIREDRDR